jgi:hypothetical protein
MMFFLIAGMPVFFIALLHVFFSGSFYGRELIAPMGIGALWFFPCCLLYALFSDLVPSGYSGIILYFSRTGLDLAFPLFFCLCSGIFTCRKRRAGARELFLHLAAFFTGFFILFAQYGRIVFSAWYAEYLYFLLPVLWMSLTSFAAFLVPRFFFSSGIVKFIVFFSLAALPFAMGMVPWLYVMNYRIAACLVTAGFFALPLCLLGRFRPQ